MISLESQVGFSELSVRNNQHEDALFVNSDENFGER